VDLLEQGTYCVGRNKWPYEAMVAVSTSMETVESKSWSMSGSQELLAHANTLIQGQIVLSTWQHADLRPKLMHCWTPSAGKSARQAHDKLIGQQMRCSWRAISKNVMPSKDIKRAIASLGWAYVSGKGRGGSHFARLRNAEPQARMPAVRLRTTPGTTPNYLVLAVCILD